MRDFVSGHCRRELAAVQRLGNWKSQRSGVPGGTQFNSADGFPAPRAGLMNAVALRLEHLLATAKNYTEFTPPTL